MCVCVYSTHIYLYFSTLAFAEQKVPKTRSNQGFSEISIYGVKKKPDPNTQKTVIFVACLKLKTRMYLVSGKST